MLGGSESTRGCRMGNASWSGREDVYRYAVPTMMCLCAVSSLGNLYILLSTRWLRRTPSPTLYLTISLCAADAWVLPLLTFSIPNRRLNDLSLSLLAQMTFLMGTSMVLQSWLPVVAKVRLWKPVCVGLGYEGLRMGAMLTSVLHLLALALNHYAGILRPLHYPAQMTPELSAWMIGALWLLPTAAFFLFFSAVPGQAFLSHECRNVAFFGRINFRLVVFAFIVLPLFLMSFIYIHIFCVILRRKRNPSLQESRYHDPPTMKRTMRATTTTTLILGTFVLGWLPSVVLFVLVCNEGCPLSLRRLNHTSPRLIMAVSLVVNALIASKALADAVIYAARVREIKAALRRMHATICGCASPAADLTARDTIRLTSLRNGRGPTLLRKSPVLARALTLLPRPRSRKNSQRPSISSASATRRHLTMPSSHSRSRPSHDLSHSARGALLLPPLPSSVIPAPSPKSTPPSEDSCPIFV